MWRLPTRAAAAAALWWSGGCFDVGTGDAPIACGADDECPTGLVCVGGLCITATGGDVVAPGVVAEQVTIAPEAVRPGEGAVVAFRVTEALGAPPAVVAPFLEVGETEGDGEAFTVPLTALAREGTHEILVDLVDVAGNRGIDIRLGALRVDGTAPAVREVTAPDTTRAGETLVVVIDASEPLSAAACVYTAQPGGRAQAVVAVVDGARATCTAPHEGNIGSGIVVDATLEDLVGNAGLATSVTSVGVIF